VDHNTFARSVGRRALQSAGILSILEAKSRREAIEFLSRPVLAIDIIFCDRMMPDMDGIQIVRHLATLTAAPTIVFVSGVDAVLLSAAENTARARGLCVIGAIEKPLTPDAVRGALARFSENPASDGSRSAIDVAPEDLEVGLKKTVPA
jgi:CheY-like chemotaxis protein